MKFILTIDNMDNDAFVDYPQGETARILRRVADLVENDAINGPCRDINGNTVGRWELS